MANTRVGQVDEDFAGAWLGHVEIDDFGGDRAGRIVDGGFIFGGEGHVRWLMWCTVRCSDYADKTIWGEEEEEEE